MAPTPMIKLNNGREMPQVGFGLWKVDNDVCADTIYNAVKAGYRLFDGACDYGNEKECGEGLARAIKEGLVKREDVFITTKLWQTFHEEHRIEPICRRQLADWQIDYFDLFLVHFPISLEYVDPETRYPPGWHHDGVSGIRRGKATNQETWRGMEGLVHKGLVRSIGISNYQAQTLYDMFNYATIQPAVLQIELHPCLPQDELVKLAKAEGLVVTAYSSFGPTSFTKDMAFAKEMQPLLEHSIIRKMADKHKRTTAQVLLRWATQRGIAVIPKTTRPAVMVENLQCTDFDLTQAEMHEIAALDINLKFNKPSNWFETDKLYLFG